MQLESLVGSGGHPCSWWLLALGLSAEGLRLAVDCGMEREAWIRYVTRKDRVQFKKSLG